MPGPQQACARCERQHNQSQSAQKTAGRARVLAKFISLVCQRVSASRSNLQGLELGNQTLHIRAMKYSDAKSVSTKFGIGDVVRHRLFPFRGVVFDIDPEYDNTEEWYQAIPEEIRPRKDQPFYHLLAENDETEYVAYVSEQNLLADADSGPLRHTQIEEMFDWSAESGRYTTREMTAH